MLSAAEVLQATDVGITAIARAASRRLRRRRLGHELCRVEHDVVHAPPAESRDPEQESRARRRMNVDDVVAAAAEC
jgi:hypothetical protein